MPVGDEERDVIRYEVWSGALAREEVEGLIDDLLLDDPDLDAEALRALAAAEFAVKAGAEAGWPAITDCDRLDGAFAALGAAGILALHDAGFTLTDGHVEAAEALAAAPAGPYRGTCFYHRQDIHGALDGGALHVAFDSLDRTAQGKAAVGRDVAEALRGAGLPARWDGDPEQRVSIAPFAWRRRTG